MITESNRTMSLNRNTYSTLGWVAMIAVPLAPASFFAVAVFEAGKLMLPGIAWLSVLIGIISAGGLEIVGILAGHLAIEFWQEKELGKAGFAAAIMSIYIALGIAGLLLMDTLPRQAMVVGIMMFLVAPLVYLLAGLRYTADEARARMSFQVEVAKVEASERQAKEDARQQELNEVRINRQLEEDNHRRQMERDAAARQHEAELEKIRVRAEVKKEQLRQPVTTQPVTVDNRLVNRVNHSQSVDELTEGQRRVYDIMQENPGIKQTEVAAQLNVTRQAVQKHVRIINGLASRPQLIQ